MQLKEPRQGMQDFHGLLKGEVKLHKWNEVINIGTCCRRRRMGFVVQLKLDSGLDKLTRTPRSKHSLHAAAIASRYALAASTRSWSDG